jgi:hypothetical protein
VVGTGVPASSGEGSPANIFPVDAPAGLACDTNGNLLVTSSSVVRLLAADAAGIVDGTGAIATIYGKSPATTFPASITHCLTGLVMADPTTAWVTDSCAGVLVALQRKPM